MTNKTLFNSTRLIVDQFQKFVVGTRLLGEPVIILVVGTDLDVRIADDAAAIAERRLGNHEVPVRQPNDEHRPVA